MVIKSFIKTFFWFSICAFIGFMPLWIKLINTSIDKSKILQLETILVDCSVLYFCAAITITICIDFFFNKKNKYFLLNELALVVGLPLFIMFWIITVTLNISYLYENERINLNNILIYTILISIATLIYVVIMKYNEFYKYSIDNYDNN